MPNLMPDAAGVFQQIQQLVTERYSQDTDVLKELIQNAEDAKASGVVFAFSGGLSSARHPLLQSPGILIVNDGDVSAADADAMEQFAGSGKQGDPATIGRFGLGQKALFHLCDAFFAKSFETSFPLALFANPCAGILKQSRADEWEEVSCDDWSLLEAEGRQHAPRGLAIWCPLRRKDIYPAAKLKIVDKVFEMTTLAQELASRAEDLTVILSALRHLDELTVFDEGRRLLSLRRREGAERMKGPPSDGGAAQDRVFSGAMTGDAPAMYVGVERFGHSRATQGIQTAGNWPNIPVMGPEGFDAKPQKASPHGAIIITPGAASRVPDIRWQETVFLPLEHQEHKPSPVDGDGIALRVLLHGYFFVDSARRGRLKSEIATPRIEAEWNDAVMRDLVLPLLPAALARALDNFIPAKAARATVAAIAVSSMFREHRAEICAEQALTLRLGGSGAAPRWALTPGPQIDLLRPLPFTEDPASLFQILPGLGAVAGKRGLLLYLDPGAALVPQSPCWKAEEISEALSSLSPRMFQSGGKVAELGRALGAMIGARPELRLAASPKLLEALRHALQEGLKEGGKLASAADIAQALQWIDRDSVFALRKDKGGRPLLRALARAEGAPLAIREEWLDGGAGEQSLSADAAAAMLAALVPLIDGEEGAAEATDAALSILGAIDRRSGDALRREDIASVPVVRAQDIQGRWVALSLRQLRDSAGLLFVDTPTAKQRLPAIAKAAPMARAWILPQDSAARLGGLNLAPGGSALFSGQKAENFLQIFRGQEVWGEPQDRLGLLRAFLSEDIKRGALHEAMRALVAGDARAVRREARLCELGDIGDGAAAALLAQVLGRRGGLIPLAPAICAALNATQKEELQIERLDAAALIAEVQRCEAEFRTLSDQDAELLLRADLPDALWQALPVHPGLDGSRHCAAALRWLQGVDPEASGLSGAPLVRPSADERLRERQSRLIAAWGAEDALRHVLKQGSVHAAAGAVLDALPQIAGPLPDSLVNQLREETWLEDRHGALWSPKQLLDLPDPVAQAIAEISGASCILPEALGAGPRAGLDDLRRLGIAPGRDHSMRALPEIIAALELTAGVFSADGPLIPELRAFAVNGAWCGLPGWPLLAALLKVDGASDELLRNCARAFAPPDAGEAAAYLDMLKDMSEKLREEAENLCADAFALIWRWSVAERKDALRNALIPTQSREWRAASTVTFYASGVDPGYLLLGKLAERCSGGVSEPAAIAMNPDRHQAEGPIDPAACDASLLHLLGAFEHHVDVPPPLLSLLAALCSRSDAVTAALRAMNRSATFGHDQVVGQLDQDLQKWAVEQDHGSVGQAVAAHCILFRPADASRIPCVSLLGERFEAAAEGGEGPILVGNVHLRPVGAIGGRTLHEFAVDDEALRTRSFSDPRGALEGLIAAVATHALGIEGLEPKQRLQAVRRLVGQVNQANCNVARSILDDEIAAHLETLKPRESGKLRRALKSYQRAQEIAGRASGHDERAKKALVMAVRLPEMREELLEAVRGAIARYGYGPHRILFELFQNAEDAAAQIGLAGAAFRVELAPDAIRVLHWGRPVNDLGPDPAVGEDKGWSRDLVNMLRFNTSEKRGEGPVTGKFGLGFKSVHMIASDVRLASGQAVACRIHGGLYPLDWADGVRQAAEAARDGASATVLELSLDPIKKAQADEAVDSFCRVAAVLPYFSRALGRIELRRDGLEAAYALITTEIDGAPGVIALRQTGASQERAIALDLGGSTRLVMRLGAEGPVPFGPAIPRLWCLAPLEEELSCGWILDGRELEIDPGRTRLNGDQRARLHAYGDALRERLMALHALKGDAWDAAAMAFGLPAGQSARQNFWQALSALFLQDAGRARWLHEDGRGVSDLLREAPIIATGLPAPYDAPVRGGDVRHWPSGLLARSEILPASHILKASAQLSGALVSEPVATALHRFGVVDAKPLTLAQMVKAEAEAGPRIDPERARALGQLLLKVQAQDDASDPEEYALQLAAKDFLYRMRGGDWRKAGLPLPCAEKDEDQLLAALAPQDHLFETGYETENAIAWLRFSANFSGANASAKMVKTWISSAESDAARRNALRYVLDGSMGRQVAEGCNAWLPKDAASFEDSDLVGGFSEIEVRRLIDEFYSDEATEAWAAYRNKPAISAPIAPEVDLRTFLVRLHDWWLHHPTAPRSYHDERAWPTGLRAARLSFDPENRDRTGWFTFFSLALFRTIGRTDDQHHRGFINDARASGWWEQLAQPHPVENFEPWRRRLEEWSRTGLARQNYPEHCSQLTDLFMLSRWLDEYVEALAALPVIIAGQQKGLNISRAFNLGASEHWQRMGLEGGPLGQAMGVGICWLLRECCRQGLYTPEQAALVRPWCYAPISRVQDLLAPFVSIDTGTEHAPDLHQLLVGELGPERSTFGGDYDLPLRFISHNDWDSARRQLLAANAPSLSDLVEPAE